ncbi:hypothetical protein SNE40_016888 [Patella caerulea]|uniref:Uncharacterized protein n=1 Tax=Patella caerulea TaxID=87958 RepID=A0AAN8JCT7_PATCE
MVKDNNVTTNASNKWNWKHRSVDKDYAITAGFISVCLALMIIIIIVICKLKRRRRSNEYDVPFTAKLVGTEHRRPKHRFELGNKPFSDGVLKPTSKGIELTLFKY